VAVLETAADGSAKDSVSLLDRQYLTNVLREQAVKELPATEDFTIMTRENILQMLPPGKAIEDCEGSWQFGAPERCRRQENSFYKD
jgi:hypothetical protein